MNPGGRLRQRSEQYLDMNKPLHTHERRREDHEANLTAQIDITGRIINGRFGPSDVSWSRLKGQRDCALPV
jgi:hypothetical protein